MSNYSRKTLNKMNINATVGSYNILSVPYTGSDFIDQGRAITRDATTKKARFATSSDTQTLLNWSPSDMTTVKDWQTNVFDDNAPVQPLEAGGLAGVVGNNVPVHIKTSEFDTAGAYAIGNYICISPTTPGQLIGVAPGSISGKISFGQIYNVEGGRVFFYYNSIGVSH